MFGLSTKSGGRFRARPVASVEAGAVAVRGVLSGDREAKLGDCPIVGVRDRPEGVAGLGLCRRRLERAEIRLEHRFDVVRQVVERKDGRHFEPVAPRRLVDDLERDDVVLGDRAVAGGRHGVRRQVERDVRPPPERALRLDERLDRRARLPERTPGRARSWKTSMLASRIAPFCCIASSSNGVLIWRSVLNRPSAPRSRSRRAARRACGGRPPRAAGSCRPRRAPFGLGVAARQLAATWASRRPALDAVRRVVVSLRDQIA